jgi:hypothetical protein
MTVLIPVESQAHAELKTQFEALVSRVENFAGARFRHLNPEAKAEAVQNATALCWFRLLDLAKQGKHQDEGVVNSMIYWSITHTSQGRLAHGQGQAKGKCARDYARRRLKGVKLDRMDLDHHVSLESPVPVQAAFRIDTSAWLATLSERDRQIAIDLAEGFTTGEVAKRHGVSPARVSQLRREFQGSFRGFHGEAA